MYENRPIDTLSLTDNLKSPGTVAEFAMQSVTLITSIMTYNNFSEIKEEMIRSISALLVPLENACRISSLFLPVTCKIPTVHKTCVLHIR